MNSRRGYTLLGLLVWLIAVIGGSASAQVESARIELAAQQPTDEVLLHVRVLRGQTIERATLTDDDDFSLDLTAEPVALPVTRWIVLDASDSMVNLQSAVQSSVQRFLRSSDAQTGIVIYDEEVEILRPTAESEAIDTFLADYTATAGEPGCLADALDVIAQQTRDAQRSMRVLVVMGGLSRQTTCSSDTLPEMPAPVDVIAVTDDVSDDVQELVERSGGELITANLRTVEARVNEVRTQWGQPTYALRGTLDDGQSLPNRADLTIALSNDIEETVSVRFREYDFPAPIEPTATATDIVLATIPARETDVPPTATSLPDPTATPDDAAVAAPLPTENEEPPPTAPVEDTPMAPAGGDNLPDRTAILLIIGAVLFVVGVVVFALALANIRRSPATQPTTTNFYDTLDDDDTANNDDSANTRIGDRDIVREDDEPATQMATIRAGDPQAKLTETDTNVLEETRMSDDLPDDANSVEDELLKTRVLEDDEFRAMMQRSTNEDEIVAWLRLEGRVNEDYALRRRGALVGRSQECDIQIRGDSAISRKHVRLDVQADDSVNVTRLSTTNRVVVRGKQVANQYPLRPTDVIHLSDQTRLVFIQRTEAEAGIDTLPDDETQITPDTPPTGTDDEA